MPEEASRKLERLAVVTQGRRAAVTLRGETLEMETLGLLGRRTSMALGSSEAEELGCSDEEELGIRDDRESSRH